MPAARTLLPVLALATLPLVAQTQAPVARYTLDGQPAVVSTDDLALELVQRHQRTQRGRDAVEHAIHHELVRAAAQAAGITPTASEVGAWIEDLRAQLKQGGHDLDAQLSRQGMTRAEFAEHARSAVAHERLVMQALGLKTRKEVTSDLLELWLKEARGKTTIVTDEKLLPAGCVAKVGGTEIPRLELGRVLMRNATPDERLQFARQIAWLRLVGAAARQNGVEVSEAEAKAEVAARRRQFEGEDGRTGVRFDQVLAAEGLSPEDLIRWPVLVGQILEQKLSRHLHPDAELAARIAKEREAVLRRHGARRRIELILVKPDPRARNGEAEARERAARLRETILADLSFAQAARKHSDDPTTRVSGGDTGWHAREGSPLPEELLAAAFAAKLGDVSEPVATSAGFWLVRLAGIEPEPNDATLQQRLRDELVNEYRRELFERARFEMIAAAR